MPVLHAPVDMKYAIPQAFFCKKNVQACTPGCPSMIAATRDLYALLHPEGGRETLPTQVSQPTWDESFWRAPRPPRSFARLPASYYFAHMSQYYHPGHHLQVKVDRFTSQRRLWRRRWRQSRPRGPHTHRYHRSQHRHTRGHQERQTNQTMNDQRMVQPQHADYLSTLKVTSQRWNVMDRVTATQNMSSRLKNCQQSQTMRRK